MSGDRQRPDPWWVNLVVAIVWIPMFRMTMGWPLTLAGVVLVEGSWLAVRRWGPRQPVRGWPRVALALLPIVVFVLLGLR